jgi:hypothetical protein
MDASDAFVVGILLGIAAILVPGWLWRRRSRPRNLIQELAAFFGKDPNQLAIVTRTFTLVDLPNLQLAIVRYAEQAGAKKRVLGYSSQYGEMGSDLRTMIRSKLFFDPSNVAVAPILFREVDVDVDARMQCVENGIHLLDAPAGKIAVHVRNLTKFGHGGLELEILAETPDLAAGFIEAVRGEIAKANVYRRKVLSLECDANQWGGAGCANVRFHRFPEIRRADIILPEQTLELLERNTVRFFRKADLLRKSGRAVKRGLLLHGKPGTGKTYTAKWLARSLEGVTVILLSGEQLWLIKQCCQMARMLAPTLIIMEDVDLIATARDESRHPLYQITLHQLLNEMDGLASDAEVLFLLTTNRPDALEMALATRPGRIDQAIEYPLPDAHCRRRLLDLYGRGLCLSLSDPHRIVEKTDGASPAFIQELVRKAALIAAEEDSLDQGKLKVTDHHLDLALRELVLGGGELTKQLLGFTASTAAG